jgi:diaminopimelate decarboxylase
MPENIKEFESCLNALDLDYRIFYAHKPNKSIVFPAVAKKSGIGIDVASIAELHNALSIGFLPSEIEATGPKSHSFLTACIEAGIMINVDSLRELESVGKLSREKNKLSSVLIRLSNFSSTAIAIKAKLERFGVEYAQIDRVWEILKNYSKNILLRGFSFHINTNSLPERLVAVEHVIKATLAGQTRGHDQCSIVNIGGGYQANFIKKKDEWDDYLLQLKEYALGTHPERLSFTGTAFGYFAEGKAIKGSYTFQDFYNPTPKAAFLKKILQHQLPEFENRSVSTVIAEHLLELWLEPGQGLLDQCGITLARIIDIKSVQNEQIIVTEMNYTNLDSDRYELFTDPVHLTFASPSRSEPGGYFISGDLCLSIDLIANHKVYLDKQPQPGDILAFINTAAYRMDFVESQPLHHPIATKIVVSNNQIQSESDFVAQITHSK